jgi:pilus assembly protein CpaC
MRARRFGAKVAALIVYIIVILVATPHAQQQVAFSGAPGMMTAGPAATVSDATSVDLLVGRSTILNVGSNISRVSLTVPDVADAMVTAPQQLLIHGKTPGTISLFVWDRAGGIKTYEVVVRRDLTHLLEQVKQLFPGETITVVGSGKDVVLSGTVTSKYVVDKAAEVASGYVEKKENVVNLLKQQEGVASNQVMLRVRFAEVSRSALTELGVNLFTGPTGYKDWIARTTTQQFSAPNYSDMERTADLNDNLTSASGKYSLSDFLNIFVFNNKYNIGTVIRALQEKGLFQSLAEPNLIASNGKEASFLAGGEYPYPIVQPGTGGNAVTILFKEYGIRLNFTPTVLNGDMINLKVRPEVSALDFSSALTLNGFRVPALSTRRTETEVELANGQTFAIAGLMNNTVTNTMRSIPGIGDIPILGWLFKSKAMAKNQTELVVMITPTIVRKGSMGVSEGVPSAIEPYLGAPNKTLPQPAPWTGAPRYPVNQPSGGQNRTDDAAQPKAAPAQPVMASAPVSATPMPQAPAPAQPAPKATNQPKPAPPAPAKAEPKVDAKDSARFREDQKRAEEAQKRAEEAQKAAERKAADEKAEADRKAAEEQAIADKKAAEEKAEADKKAAAEKARQEKLDAERAKREAEVAKKNADAERKRQEELKKHEKTLAEAAARLKQAQAAYQAEVDKKKGGSF